MKIKETKPYIWLRSFLYSLGLLKPKGPKDYYISKVSRKAPWVYISYIADPFYHLDDDAYMSSHQNKMETIRIVQVLNELGYNVYIQDYLSKRELPNLKNVKMVFGHEPNLIYAAEKYKGSIVVQYNTGAYVEHANSQIVRMTDYVNTKYNSNIPYRRLIEVKDRAHSIYRGYEIADKILQIGSKYTVQTMPEVFHDKIVLIHESTQNCRDIVIEDSIENHYLYLGSSGTMLKGVPLLIEYFTEHTEKNIHIVGRIEEDYMELIRNEITPNIHFYGYMNVCSDEFVKITKKCNFILYPSGTEGVPGAVLCAMKYGLIPIVTPWAAFDEIEDYGFLMDYNWNVNSIAKGIDWATSMSKEERFKTKNRCKQYVNLNYNIEKFTEEFRRFCVDVLGL